jgi:hypothetical protein
MAWRGRRDTKAKVVFKPMNGKELRDGVVKGGDQKLQTTFPRVYSTPHNLKPGNRGLSSGFKQYSTRCGYLSR